MESVDKNDAIFTRCQGDACVQIIKSVFHPPAETHSLRHLRWNFLRE